MNKTFLEILLFAAVIFTSHAQGPNDGFIMEGEGIAHQLSHPNAVYPPIARAAHMQANVLLHVSVNAEGKVTQVKAVGGPPMLIGAAKGAVQQWTYKPFLKDGRPVAVEVVVTVPFSLGIPSATERSDNAISNAYFPKENECRSASSAQNWTDALKLCAEAAAIADRFPEPSLRANEIRSAHQLYGNALVFSHNFPEAFKQLHLATANAEKTLTPKDAEYASAFLSLAFAEHSARMLSEAERDYNIAETSYRAAIVNLPDMKMMYGRSLAHTLAYHSVLVEQTGDPAKAKAMQAEALTLDPHALDGMKAAQ